MRRRLLANILVKDVQCDEIWGYVAKKEAHKFPFEAHDNSIGDAYCFVAIERGSKLILNFALRRRDQATTDAFIEGLRGAYCRTAISTHDGWISAVHVLNRNDTWGSRGLCDAR